MKTLLALLLVCVGVNSSSPSRKTCIASLLNIPVCGSDGRTYFNEQELKCYQESEPDLRQVSSRMCKNPEVKRDCNIVNLVIPVCGSDGVSYQNIEELICNIPVKPGLHMKYLGSCKPTPPQSEPIKKQCISSGVNIPVCGNDGHTYDNEQELICHQENNPDLKMAAPRMCKNPEVKRECFIPNLLIPVCGTDGLTYQNIDELICNIPVKSGLLMKHVGRCMTTIFPLIPDPTLASAAQQRPAPQPQQQPVQPQQQPAQPQQQPAQPQQQPARRPQQPPPGRCVCPRNINRACGTNGRTYSNKCLLDCDARRTPGLRMKYRGPCRAESSSSSSSESD